MDKKSIVLAELDNHLRHLFEYRFFNKFYNAVEIICRYTIVVTAISVIVGAILYSNTHEYDEISFLDVVKLIFGLSFLIISMVIILRELTIIFYSKVYGENFKQYVAVSEEDINKTIAHMKSQGYNDEMISEFEMVLKKYKYKENGLYVIFTDGINKKVIKELMKIELNYTMNRKVKEKKITQ
jgi:hypothetical protein